MMYRPQYISFTARVCAFRIISSGFVILGVCMVFFIIGALSWASHDNYTNIKAMIVDPSTTPPSTTMTPQQTKKNAYLIYYSYNGIVYTKPFETDKAFTTGQEIQISIKKDDPNEHSMSTLTPKPLKIFFTLAMLFGAVMMCFLINNVYKYPAHACDVVFFYKTFYK